MNLSEQMKENKLMPPVRNISGNITLANETPADLKLESSYRSDILPITITEEMSTAIGKAKGMREIDIYANISKIKKNPAPLPAISSIHFQRNCIIKTKMAMKKVTMNGGIKLFINKRSMMFIT